MGAETEAAIYNLPKNKIPGINLQLVCSTNPSENTSYRYSSYYPNYSRNRNPNLFYEASVYRIPKADRGHAKKRNLRLISLITFETYPQQNFSELTINIGKEL